MLLQLHFHGVGQVIVELAYFIVMVFVISVLVASFARFRPVVDEKYEH